MTGAEDVAIAELVITAGEKIYQAYRDYKAGKADADATLATLGKLHDEIDAHNKKYQAALDARFLDKAELETP